MLVIVCGVDIKAKEAVLAVVKSGSDDWTHVKCETKKLSLKDDRDAEMLASMKSAVGEFARDNKIDAFAIKSRHAKGTMAAGRITFKIEATCRGRRPGLGNSVPNVWRWLRV